MVGWADLVYVITPVAELLEDAGDGTRDHTPVNIALSTSSDSEGLARPCLAICKHCAVVSFQCADHNWLRHPLKHLPACKVFRQLLEKQAHKEEA
jgi:hypothetical protein